MAVRKPGRQARRASYRTVRRTAKVPSSLPLYKAVDNGSGVPLDSRVFCASEQGEWGRAFESFRRLNGEALHALNLSLKFAGSMRGPVLLVHPADRIGAIPLRSTTSGHVVAGFVVSPRFGWSGIGSVLSHSGWHAAPNILSLPLVPGSGREVPPWVLAGPVIARLEALLKGLVRGFDFCEDVRTSPRGTIRWAAYARRALPTGRWHHVPSRYPELANDPLLRGAVRWTLERVIQELALAVGRDRVATELRTQASRLLSIVSDVVPVYPKPEMIARLARRDPLLEQVVGSGLQAIGWVRDERGLGGGRQMDGLAWALPLDRLWEEHVAAHVSRSVRLEGGTVRLGRRGETLVPLRWSSSIHRSLGSLVPDIVVTRPESVWIVDAKYKAHMADLDDVGWRSMADQVRDSHRADLHHYGALFDAPSITVTLAYPLQPETWHSLKLRGLDRSAADLHDGGRHVRLELWGLPFAAGSDRPVVVEDEAYEPRDEF